MPVCFAGVRLTAGNYQVTPYSADGHIYVTCVQTRTQPFEIDFTGSALGYTVHPTASPYAMPCAMYPNQGLMAPTLVGAKCLGMAN